MSIHVLFSCSQHQIHKLTSIVIYIMCTNVSVIYLKSTILFGTVLDLRASSGFTCGNFACSITSLLLYVDIIFFCFTFPCCYSYCVRKMEGFLYKKCALDTNDKFGRWFLGHFIVFINFNYFANRMYLYCVSNVWKFQKKTDSWLQRKIYAPVSCYWVNHPLCVDHIGIQKSAV